MTDGRTYWWGKDSGWWRRERIVLLGEEFGAAGPAVIDWLACEAKAQNDAGRVKAGVRSLSRGCFVDVVTVGHVLSRSVAIGLLDDFEEADGLFTCRISGWEKDQERSRAADRQARARARRSAADDGDPPAPATPPEPVTGRDESRPVTGRHASSRIQERTEEERTEATPPTPPSDSEPGRAEHDLASTVDAVLVILERCPRFTIDPIATRIAVENALGAVGPEADPIAAAHEAVVWATDPAHRKTNAGSVFLDALRKQKLTLVHDRPRPARGGGGRHSADERVDGFLADAEQARREEGAGA